ncbi:hypothetical protein PHJA_001742100 [Phtheirospermum japonicum]|uniref:Uncharacterized protein n=1 Tax=Phtheirospermum japonicum TaxID=374723 RepID=A0A830C8T2_9LAMI|nr:hypothetical protein PHJA_001742100 [Phtheirospermum japonicum]
MINGDELMDTMLLFLQKQKRSPKCYECHRDNRQAWDYSLCQRIGIYKAHVLPLRKRVV